jgi:hypothetical protein
MGTWDIGPFDNDTAVDWTYGLRDSDGFGYVEDTLDQALAIDSAAVMDADVGVCAVAAAAALARALDDTEPSSAYMEAVDEWAQRMTGRPPRALLEKARAALIRVGTAPSALLELWGEGGGDGWVATLDEIAAHLA